MWQKLKDINENLCVVSLGPVVARPALSEDEVVRPEDLAIGSAPHRVHRAWLEVNKDGPGNVLAPGGLIVVHIDPLQLQVRGAGITAAGVDAVLIRDDFPELKGFILESKWKLRLQRIYEFDKPAQPQMLHLHTLFLLLM